MTPYHSNARDVVARLDRLKELYPELPGLVQELDEIRKLVRQDHLRLAMAYRDLRNAQRQNELLSQELQRKR